MKYFVPFLILIVLLMAPLKSQNLPKDFIDPPREFSVMPFWFWNDTLKDEEIVHQIADLRLTECTDLSFIRVSVSLIT